MLTETYNLDEAYFLPIMHYLSMADTETTFHFEIKADLLSENTLRFLETVPEGRFQFEIGVQSTNDATLKAIGRENNWENWLIMLNACWPEAISTCILT